MRVIGLVLLGIGAAATVRAWHMPVTVYVGSDAVANFHGMHQQMFTMVWAQFQVGFGLLLIGIHSITSLLKAQATHAQPAPPTVPPVVAKANSLR